MLLVVAVVGLVFGASLFLGLLSVMFNEDLVNRTSSKDWEG